MSVTESAVDFVRYVLDQVCKEKDQINVEVVSDDRGVMIKVQVASDDMGRLIGKRGQNISAVRTLVRVMGAKEGEKISVKVVEQA